VSDDVVCVWVFPVCLCRVNDSWNFHVCADGRHQVATGRDVSCVSLRTGVFPMTTMTAAACYRLHQIRSRTVHCHRLRVKANDN